MTDNYEWMKTNESQSSSDYSPYTVGILVDKDDLINYQLLII